ncbi:MAG: hypothetical protein IKE95_00940 [Methanobrevibacter sp.]|nr:hypothetical protein [Methanobrevibacter sp.]
MSEDKITYKDIEEYDNLFSMAPPILLKRFARKNTNLVLKFQSVILSHINTLNVEQKRKLDLILNMTVDELQGLMKEAYLKTNKKQYKILSDSKYKPFIENNINELRKIV